MPPPETGMVDAVRGPRWMSVMLPVVILGAVLVLIVPVPPAVLDLLLSANITLGVVILLTTLAVSTPRQFSVFPTILLTTTVFRLVLAVATTRLILTRAGDHGLDAAGGVVRAFGEFVTGDQVLVGGVIFVILVVIQLLVITKGAARISEVAARFMLDGLPGRQMAIDADLHAGAIDQAEAHRRRDAVYRQADFFGAMDGAGKFVRGDALAGTVIAVVNIVVGLALGIGVHGMDPAEAVDVFTKLTIGDGLVSQVPALLISLAAGLIVTRTSESSDLGRDVSDQLFTRPEVLAGSSGLLVILAFTGLPTVPLLVLAAALGWGAYWLWSHPAAAATNGEALSEHASSSSPRANANANANANSNSNSNAASAPTAAAIPAGERVEDLLHVDPLELEIGYRLIALADPNRKGDLLERVQGIRHGVAKEMGLIVPQVRIRDEITLGPHQYRFKIRGAVVGQGIAYAGRLLAIPPAGLSNRPDGRDGVDPVTCHPAVWIHAEGREVAELAGCIIREASGVIAGHLGEIVRAHAEEILTREQVSRLLERVHSTSPTLVDEVVPAQLRAGELQRILQNLLRERVSIRDLETILEAIAMHVVRTRDLDHLTEHVRRALGRRITQQYRSADGRLHAVILTKGLEGKLAELGAGTTAETWSDMTRTTVKAISLAVVPLIEAGLPPVVLCAPEARPVLRDLTHVDLPRLAVLSQREIPRDTPVETVATVGVEIELDQEVSLAR